MLLDLTLPTVVLTGTWNAPIFTAPWIARELFEYPIGEEVAVAEVVFQQATVSRHVLFLKNIGIHAEPQRLELYANDNTDQHFARIEGLIRRILTVLPHTPIGALGVNFRFSVKNPSAYILDKLQTHEEIHLVRHVLSSKYITQISVDENVVCNITRDATDELMNVDFNYHFEGFGAKKGDPAVTDGILKKFLAGATNFMSELYDETDYEVGRLDFKELGPQWAEGNE